MHFDRMDVGQPLQPEFRDPAIFQFIVGAFSVLGEAGPLKSQPRSAGPPSKSTTVTACWSATSRAIF